MGRTPSAGEAARVPRETAGAISLAVGLPLTILLGVAFPAYFFAVATSMLIAWAPVVGMISFTALEGFRLALVGAGISSSLITQAASIALILAGVFASARLRPAQLTPLTNSVLVGLLLIGPGALVGMFTLPAGQFAAGVALLLVPVAALLIGLGMSKRANAAFRLTLLIVVLANVGASLYQLSTGTAGLLAQGYTYGVTIREIDGVLRAPGLTMTNGIAGMLGAAALVYFVADILLTDGRLARLGSLLGIGLAGLLVFTATSRSGLIMAGVATLVVALRAPVSSRFPAQATRVLRGILTLGAAFVAISAFVSYGASSAFSLTDRFSVWEQRVDGGLSLFGQGLGSVGSASYSADSQAAIFVDNSWLSLLLQYGILSFILLIVLFVLALMAVAQRAKSQSPRATAAQCVLMAVLLAVAVVALVIEVLDLPAAAAILGLTVGRALKERNGAPAGGSELASMPRNAASWKAPSRR